MEHGNTVIFVTLLLLTNMLASIRVVQKVVSKYEENAASDRFKQAGIITGINQLLGGLFSAIGPVAISGSAGFIATTNIYKRLPFILGSSFIIVVSIFPKITSFFAANPCCSWLCRYLSCIRKHDWSRLSRIRNCPG